MIGKRIAVVEMTGERSTTSRPSSARPAEDTRGALDRISAPAILRFFSTCQTRIIPLIVLSYSFWEINGNAAFNFNLVTNGSWLPISAVTITSATLCSAAFYLSGRSLKRQPSRNSIIQAVFVLWAFGPALACAGWLLQTKVPFTYISPSDLNISLLPGLAWAFFWTCFLLGSRWIRNEYLHGHR